MLQSFGLPLLIIGASIGLVFMYTLPKYNDIEGLKTRERALDSSISDAERVDEIIGNLKQQYDSFPRSAYEKLEVMLPADVEPIDAIVEVNSIAQRHGVMITEVSEIEGQSQNQNQQNTFFQVPDTVQTISTSYSFTSDYFNFLDFMRSLERGLRLTDVNSIDISVDRDTGLIEASIETDTYSLNQ